MIMEWHNTVFCVSQMTGSSNYLNEIKDQTHVWITLYVNAILCNKINILHMHSTTEHKRIAQSLK